MTIMTESSRRPFLHCIWAMATILALSPPAPADASGADGPAGRLLVEEAHGTISLPMLRSHYEIAVDGDVATIALSQTFFNPTDRPLDATYLFPLGTAAAVTAMEMHLGDLVVHAEVQRKEEAEQTFQVAQEAGQAAALLTQHRPNMFTQSIANLMPRHEVRIVLHYVRDVPKIDGAYELAVPMVVGPRYEGDLPADRFSDTVPLSGFDDPIGENADSSAEALLPTTPEASSAEEGRWLVEALPAYPPLQQARSPETVDPRRLTLSLRLTAPGEPTLFASRTHKLAVEGADNVRHATFEEGAEIDNRDFVLRYAIADDAAILAGAVGSVHGQRGGFLSLMIEPPSMPDEASVVRRDLVFVVDTSGSMTGAPMRAARHFMDAAMRGLRPDDTFRILSFANTTRHFAADAMPADKAHVDAARRYIAGMTAGGGTEMSRAITAAFDSPARRNAQRIVVFLTDGYIGADREVIAKIARVIGKDRLYAFGIGSSVNRYLLEGMAREGRGYLRIVEPGDSAEEVAETLARDLKSPLLTDIAIDWNGLAVEGQSPATIPDLFAGGSVRILARYDADQATTEGGHLVYVDGLVNGRSARMPVRVRLPARESEAISALPAMWARGQIADLERDYAIGRQSPAVKEAIVKLGLEFQLQSAFTSFVAVAREIVNPGRMDDPSATRSAPVPLAQALHVPNEAYPQLNLAGSSTPEPHVYLGLLLAIMAIGARHARRLAGWLGRCGGRRPAEAVHPRRPVPPGGVPDCIAQDGWWLSEEATRS